MAPIGNRRSLPHWTSEPENLRSAQWREGIHRMIETVRSKVGHLPSRGLVAEVGNHNSLRLKAAITVA
jgi:hypothetical protein